MPELLLKGLRIGSIKGILFDKDGTLSNSESHLICLAKLRIKIASELLTLKKKSRYAVPNLIDMLTKAYGIIDEKIDPGGIIAVASREQNLISTATIISLSGESWPASLTLATEIFASADSAQSKLYKGKGNSRTLLPGALRFITSLQKYGIICGLISNDTCLGIEDFLRLNKLESKILSFWSAEHNPSKPNPLAVKGLCEKLKLNPDECALIGDADSDLKMAKEAGIRINLGFVGGWSKPPLLNEHEHLIQNWDDLTINDP